MKINTSGLHSIYDQYANEENRLTHALIHTISSSKMIFARFLRNIAEIPQTLGNGEYKVTTQKKPLGEDDVNLEIIESIPDAWITDSQKKMGIVIEVKDIKNALKISQLRFHAKKVQDYKHAYLLVITPDLQQPEKVDVLQKDKHLKIKVIWHSWNEIYHWLEKLMARNKRDNKKERFLIESMIGYLERRREVLGFQGIDFKNGYNVEEAKIILDAEMELLEPTVRKLYKKLVHRRSAVTTSLSISSVWDCFGVKRFTDDLHFTIGLNEEYHSIALTVPNSAKQRWKKLKEIYSDKKQKDSLFKILVKLRKKVPSLFIEFHQRHFVARKKAFREGILEFDVDTIGKQFRNKHSKIRINPIWISALDSAIVGKKNINGQVQFNAKYYYSLNQDLKKLYFINAARETIMAFKELYEYLNL